MTPRNSREAALDGFRAYLREGGHPVTPQRMRVAEVLFGTHQHISAEEIIERLRKGGRGRRGVGKATVYRTLELLRDAGLIREHDFGEGFRRYEPRPMRPRHGHLVCTRCGMVIEFESEGVERMEREIAGLHRFHPTHHKVEIHGVCEECRAGEA